MGLAVGLGAILLGAVAEMGSPTPISRHTVGLIKKLLKSHEDLAYFFGPSEIRDAIGNAIMEDEHIEWAAKYVIEGLIRSHAGGLAEPT